MKPIGLRNHPEMPAILLHSQAYARCYGGHDARGGVQAIRAEMMHRTVCEHSWPQGFWAPDGRNWRPAR